MITTQINRKTKRECQLAILDLEKRGFECVRKIHEVSVYNKDWTFDHYHRPIFSGSHTSTYWRAIMRSV